MKKTSIKTQFENGAAVLPGHEMPGVQKYRENNGLLNPRFAEMFNDGILGNDPGNGYRDGQIFIANDSRFLETFYQEPLTNYLVGWRDPNNIEETLQFFAPAVPVNRRFEYKSAVNAEEFLSEQTDDNRAIGGDFKRVVYTATDVTDKTINRGLTIIVDLDNVPNANVGGVNTQVPGWQQQRTAKLTRRLYRNSLRRAITALSAGAVTTATYSWAQQPASPGVIPPNPDTDVMAELINATNISGIRPNRVAYGDTAFLYRTQSFGSQNTPAGYQGYATLENNLAAALMVDRVKISKERYQSAAASKSEILGATVYCFYAQDDVDTEDPSNIKRFVSSFDAEQGGGLFRVYVQQISAKLIAISVELYEKTVVTYSGGIRKMPIANQ